MRHGDIWVILFFFGIVLFNWPILSIFTNAHPYAIFAIWVLFIAAAAVLSSRAGRERNR